MALADQDLSLESLGRQGCLSDPSLNLVRRRTNSGLQIRVSTTLEQKRRITSWGKTNPRRLGEGFVRQNTLLIVTQVGAFVGRR